MVDMAVLDQTASLGTVRPQGYKKIFILNSAEHEISDKYKRDQEIQLFSGSD